MKQRTYDPEWDDYPSVDICPLCDHVSEGMDGVEIEDGFAHEGCYEDAVNNGEIEKD